MSDVITSHRKTITNLIADTYSMNTDGTLIYKFILAMVYEFVGTTGDKELAKKIYAGITASHRATYYILLCPYASGSTNPYDIPVDLYDKLSKLTKSDFIKHNNKILSVFDVHRNKLIDLAGYAKSEGHDLESQMNLVEHKGTIAEYVKIMKEMYKDDTKLANDLLSVFCYLSTMHETCDETYYENVFIYNMKNIFVNPLEILKYDSDTLDVASLYSLFIMLGLSDACFYKPRSGNKISDSFKDLNGCLPTPMTTSSGKKTMFTIEHNSTMMKIGGDGGADLTNVFG